MEIQAVMDASCEEAEDDRDHLLEVQEILERLEDEAVSDELYQRGRYDLCSECHRRFSDNPLGQSMPLHLGFSDN